MKISQKKFKILIIVAGFFLFILAIVLSGHFSISEIISENYYKSAVKYMYSGQPEKAIEKLKKSIEINPKNYKARLELGSIFFYSGDLEKAKDSYEKIIEPDADYSGVSKAEAYYHLMQINSIKGDYSQAISYGERVIEEKIDDETEKTRIYAPTYSLMAKSHLYYTGDQEKIEDFLKKSLEVITKEDVYMIDKKSATMAKMEIYNTLGFYHLIFLGEIDQAVEYFNKIIEMRPEEIIPSAYYGLGKAYFFAGDYRKSLYYLHIAKELHNPNNDFLSIQIYDELGKVSSQLGNCEEAIEYFDKVLEKVNTVAFMADYMKQFEKAVVKLALGHCASMNGEEDKALSFLEESLDLFIKSEKNSFYEELLYNAYYITVNYKIAEIQYKKGMIEEAQKNIRDTSNLIDSLSSQMIEIIDRTYWPKEETLSIFDNVQNLKLKLEQKRYE